MDTTELHYISFDPEDIFREMQYAFIDAGGDVLYPGDEKEMLLRSVQATITQAFASVDNALRMATLRYADGDYLDLYGEKRGCSRIEAQNAAAAVEITLRATGRTGKIAAGTPLTADGERMYVLTEDVIQTGYARTVRATVVADVSGSAGNGLLKRTQMQFLVPQDAVESVWCVEDAYGGQEREEDEAYRERIRTFGLTQLHSGPQEQYEAVAKNVTSEILDARAANLGNGKVGVALLLASDTGSAAVIRQVTEALNDVNVRPLTDEVTVYLAEEIPYTLNVLYKMEPGVDISLAIEAAANQYRQWQGGNIGKPFNPDRLVAELYRAGATRIMFDEGSNFNDGDATYTEIPPNACCRGTVTVQEME